MRDISADYQSCSDEALMLLLKDGDEQAFVELYDRFCLPIYHYFLRIFSGDRMRAEDLLQDFFLKIFARARSFDPLYKFRNWAFTIAQNMCKNEFRKKDRIKNSDLFEQRNLIGQPNVEEQLDLKMFKKELSRALETLSFEQRSAFLLFYQAGFKIPEISRIQECSIGTVKSRLFYACKKLSHLLAAFNPELQEKLTND